MMAVSTKQQRFAGFFKLLDNFYMTQFVLFRWIVKITIRYGSVFNPVLKHQYLGIYSTSICSVVIVEVMSLCVCVRQVALDYVNKYGVKFVRVLTLEKNRGKGGAVRMVCWKWIAVFLLLFIIVSVVISFDDSLQWLNVICHWLPSSDSMPGKLLRSCDGYRYTI